jgi:serine phosphatase RsbU (regulator of sigma subunit)
MIFDDKTRRYEVYYSRFSEKEISVQPLERGAKIIRWFVKNQDILRLERVYSEDHKLDDERDSFLEFFKQNELKVIMPIYHDNRVFGIICLGDKESLETFNPDEMKELDFFRKECNAFISISIAYKKSIEDQYISRTVVLSSELQTKTIPQSLPNLSSIKFGAFYIPKYSDESNYFDFVRPSGQGVGVIATDISGVGINAALYSVLLRAAFQTSINEAPSTFSVMQKLNRVIYEYAKGNPGLITSLYFYYDIKSMKLMYTNAGFPPLEVFRIDKNNFDSLDTEGVPLGNDPKSTYGIGRTNLLRGDIGILYSKSFASSKNQEGEDFSLTRLRRLVADNRVRKPSEISERIKSSFEAFMGIAVPSSDVFVLVFKIV